MLISEEGIMFGFRSGDLMNRAHLQTEIPAVPEGVSGRWTDNLGHHLIRTVEVDIGGQRIDRQYGDWLQIWSQLKTPLLVLERLR